MKTLITLSIVLLSALYGKAQTKTDKVLLIGISKVTPDVKDGLFKAHMQRNGNQVALVSACSFQSTYYAIYDAQGRIVRTGKFTKRHAGEYDLVDIGPHPCGYNIAFSNHPIVTR